jgi:hypothetical protein
MIEYTQIQLSPNQAEFLAWTNAHYHQLIHLKNSGCLDKGGTSFTVHLKDSTVDFPPIVDHLDLNGKYYPS